MASGLFPFVAPRRVPAMLAQELTDSEATRRVFLTVGGLLLLGLAMLIATVWWWRSTRPEHPALAPLEVMSERRWAKADGESRQSLIDARRRPVAETDGRPAPAIATAAATGPAVAGSGAATVGSGPGAQMDPVDLSVLVGSATPSLDDFAAIDRMLGLVPDDAEVEVEVEVGAADADAMPPVDDVAEVDGVDDDDEVADDDNPDDVVADADEVAEVVDLRDDLGPVDEDGPGDDAIDPLLQRASVKD